MQKLNKTSSSVSIIKTVLKSLETEYEVFSDEGMAV